MESPRTDKERKDLIKRLAGKKLSPDEVKRGSGRIPEKFRTMPRAKVSNGSSLEALAEDREDH